jgi:hypothetical protein
MEYAITETTRTLHNEEIQRNDIFELFVGINTFLQEETGAR